MKNKIEITIPTSLSEITLSQFLSFQRMVKRDENQSQLTDSELSRIVLRCFCGLEFKDTLKVKSVDAESIRDIVLQMLNESPKRVERFVMDGVEYGLIPDLNDMTLGEHIDIDKFITDYETMDKAMAVLYRPVKNKKGKLYNIDDYEPLKYNMLEMPMDAVMYGQVFFYNLGIDLLKHTTHFSQDQETDLLEKMGLTKNGDGTHRFMDSLEGILLNMNISLN